ncbi:MAG: hypothetical protein IS632_08905 [Thaumarchaeota archaeon]|nr:hypothetical protein [Nitrososphaerota archaeon]
MRVDRHLSERGMREAMSRLYAAMVLSEANTEALRNGEAGRGSVEAVGSPTAVSCMNGLGWWLNTLRMYAEPDPFVDAIEAPLRRSAEFLQHMRTLRPRRSTDIRALVFAVSDPYYDYASDRDLRTVSAVAPDLENVVYVRMDDWGGGDVPGWYVFTGVQPILLVNRLRMTRGSSVTPAGTAGDGAGLAGMAFLNCPLSGANDFRRSLAMENFCEVHSWQRDGMHMLGAPLVLHGRVSSVDHYRIGLAGCGRDGAFLSAYLSEDADRMRPAGLAAGAYVRVLAVSWYRGDADTGPEPEAEVYVIEETDRDGAVAGDAAGLARVAGPVSVSDMLDRYGCVPESGLLERAGDRVVFRRAGGAAEGLCREFVRAADAVRKARLEARGSIHCFPENVFSDRVTDDRIAHVLVYDREKRDALLRIIEAKERGGAADHETDGPPARAVRWLRQMGLAEGDDLAATQSGRRHGYKCAKSVVGLRLDPLTAYAVFVPDLDAPGIPPSFVYKYLEDSGYVRAKVRGYKCRLVMCRKGAPEPDLERCAGLAGALMEAVLEEFDAVSHPLTPEYLAEKMKAGGRVPPVYVEYLLNAMESGGIVRRDGDSWSVPLDDSISRVLERNTGHSLTTQQIMRELSIPRTDGDAVDVVLDRLRKSGTAIEILRGRWAAAGGGADALAHGAYETAVDLYGRLPENRRRRTSVAAFLPYLGKRLWDLGMRAGRQEAAKRAVDRMVADGKWTGPL